MWPFMLCPCPCLQGPAGPNRLSPTNPTFCFHLRELRTPPHNWQEASVAISRPTLFLPQKKNQTEVCDFWPQGMIGYRRTLPSCPTAHMKTHDAAGYIWPNISFIIVHSVTTDRHTGSGWSTARWRMVCVSQKQGRAVGTSRIQK